MQITAPSLGPQGERNGLSLKEWFNDAAATAPVVLCLDSNSSPSSKSPDVWKALNNLRSGIHNSWEEYYDKEGSQLQQVHVSQTLNPHAV